MFVDPKVRVARTRRRMILFSLPVVLLALFVAWKLISMPVLAGRGIDAYERGQFETSSEAFDSLMFLNVAEDWIPYFGRGTAFAAGELYSQATDDLAKALERAPADRRCDIRVNLALAWELQGDAYFAAGYFAGAAKLYETAKAVVDAGSAEGCFQPPPPDEKDGQDEQDGQDQQDGQEQADPQQPEDAEQKLEEADRRITDKLSQSEQQQQQEGQDPDPVDPDQEESGDGGKVDELREKGDAAEEERQNQDSTQRGQENSRDYVEKPW